MKKLLGLVFNRWVMALLGVGLLGLLVWWAGPLLAFADYRPLEGETARLVLIGLIALGVFGRMVWKLLQARRANGKLMDGLLGQRAPAPAAAPQPGAEEVAALGERFAQAIAALKQARVAGDGLGRFGRQWVYELPWYIFIGAPGSGKTTALVNSGLQFPLADRFGQGAISGVGGTRNCDWWFSNDAVLLDTAGRYTTQQSDQQVDSAAWSGFLELLKKYRSRRPINGVLLTLSVAELLEQSDAQRDAHLAALRKRIEDLHQRLGIRFPLYVLVTKADLLAGFVEFFAGLGKEEREQVWGATLAYAAQGPAPQAHFGAELDALQQRIDARLVDRLQQERDPQRRARLYVFPQQLHHLRAVLDDFLERLFAPSSFADQPLVRGVYFTSATQEGSPIDRIMGGLGRALQLERKVLMPGPGSGRSFFLTRLLKEVVFPEAGLAGTNLRWERRRTLMQAATLAAALLLACAAAGAWSVSYLRNRSYVAEVDNRRAVLARQVAALDPAGSNADVLALLPLLESAQRLAAPPGGDGAPWTMQAGLYQGGKLGAAAQDAYDRLLRDAFLPRLALRIEQQLRSDARSNPELLYEGLKAYLMLHDARHLDAAALKAFITADWVGRLPHEAGNAQRRALEGHLDALLARGDAMAAALPADAGLIAATRLAIARTPLDERIYNRLKRQEVGAGFPEFTIAKAAGPSAALVFARASGQPLTSGVPGLYSFDGYYKAFASASERVSKQLADEEDWVLGQQGGSALSDAAGRARLLGAVRQRYLQDYARIWEAFVGDIRLVRAANLQQSIELARILSAPNSPLPLLLRAIVHEVTLVRLDPAEKSTLDKAGDKVRSAREDLLKLFGQQQAPAAAAPGQPEDLVDRRFEELRRLVRGQAGAPAPIDATIALINELYTLLTATEAALKGGTTPPPSEVPTKIKAEGNHMPEPVRSMLHTLAGGGAAQAAGVTRGNLDQAMRGSVYEYCNKAIAGRYPFAKGSARDVTQEDFGRLFAAGGVLDEFFQKNLAPFVNTATRPWTFRNMGEASLGGGSGALLQFQRAQAIREVFFRAGPQAASMRLEFKPLSMDASITQFILDVDGQLVKYSHGPQVPAQVLWPGPRGSTQVRVQLSPAGSGASGLLFEGPWALFRMFDQVEIEGGSQPEKFIATFNVDGRKAQFEVLTGSVQNPFRLRELEQFQCPGQL